MVTTSEHKNNHLCDVFQQTRYVTGALKIFCTGASNLLRPPLKSSIPIWKIYDIVAALNSENGTKVAKLSKDV